MNYAIALCLKSNAHTLIKNILFLGLPWRLGGPDSVLLLQVCVRAQHCTCA